MELRPHQTGALDAVAEEYSRGTNRLLVVMATGTGKTPLIASVKKRLGFKKRQIILAHTDELVQQAVDKVAVWNPEAKIGVEKAERTCSVDDDYVVASVQTIGRDGSSRLLQFQPTQFDSIITDEAHHAAANSYQRIYEYFGFTRGRTDGLLLGVTATPNRPDGKGLGETFQKVVYQYSMLQAIRDGWLSNLRGYRIRTSTSLDGVRTQAGDLQQNDLSLAVNTTLRNEQVAKEWLERAGDRSTIAFTADIQHAKEQAEAFRNAGATAAAIWGDDPERKSKLLAHRGGEIQVLTNCGVLTEGYDDWRVGCIVLARPTKSQLLFTQMVGRGTRIEDGIGNLIEWLAAGNATSKEDCIVLDVCDNTLRHKLVSLCDLFGLPTKADLKGRTVTEALDLFEQASMTHPDTDLSACEDFDSLSTYAEEVDLFTVSFADEVMEHSELQWHKTPQGNYLLLLPGRERVTMCPNILGHWEIRGLVQGTKFEASTQHLGNAFYIADQKIRQFGRRILNNVRRESKAAWKDDPISPEQIKTLKWQLDKRGKGYPKFEEMSKAEGNMLLSKLFATGA